MTTTLNLAPWGRMADHWWVNIGSGPQPDHWTNAVPFRQWLEQTADELATLIWPRYDEDKRDWYGPLAHATRIDALHAADFELLKALHPVLDQPMDAAVATNILHADFFLTEDEGGFAGAYAWYDPKLDRELCKHLPGKIEGDKGYRPKLGAVHLQLKHLFQRPRAYQVAFMQGRTDFSYRDAMTASTPSLISGHCLQGALIGCSLSLLFRDSGVTAKSSYERLKQFSVDIGDRRVFAGVHYPSDNLSSWYTALKLVPMVFEAQHAGAVSDFLREAIRCHSTVYRSIADHARRNPGSPYQPALDALRELGV